MRRPSLVVVPTDPVEAYSAKGNAGGRANYYNPTGVFKEWAIGSPWHLRGGEWQGHTVAGVAGGRLGGYLRQVRPDAVRAYGGHWPATLARAAAPTGVRVVASLHDSAPGLFGPGLAGCDRVFAVSPTVAELAQAAGVDAHRIRLIPNRVDTTRFAPDSAPSGGPVPPSILFVGRLTRQKNLETLLAALAQLPPEFTLTVVGLGDRAPYERIAASLGVASRVAWHPSVANEALPALYQAHGIFATPSRWEGFGIVFLEAAACGCAIVAPAVAPVDGLLTDGANARLVPPEDPTAWASAIRDMRAEPSLTQALRVAARARALEFDRGLIDAREAEAYRELLAESAREFSVSDRRALRPHSLRAEARLLVKGLIRRQLRLGPGV